MPDKKSDKHKIKKDWETIANEDNNDEIPIDFIDENNATAGQIDDEDSDGGETSANPQAAIGHPNYEELEATLTKTEQEKQKYYDEVLRLHAEIANIQKRHEMRLSEAHQFSIERFANELLPIIDSLEKALEQPEIANENLQQMREGVDLTLKMFMDSLAKFGITPINPEKQAFDPQYHEAMSMQPAPEGIESNTVLHVFQKGYLLKDRLLRPARVIVTK
ncbi:MAG: nucleotide exchange factor GrpE [Pseudomonadota bacterium]